MAAQKEKKSSHLPKELAGVKLGKGLRKKLVDLAKQPMVADLLAAGLIALAAKLKGETAPKKLAGDVPAKPVEGAEKPAKPAAKRAASKATKPAAPKPAKPAAANGVKSPAAKSAKPAAKSKKPAAAKSEKPTAPETGGTDKPDASKPAS